MKHTKKAQLESLFNWFMALIIIFGIMVTTMVLVKPWQAADNQLSPKIEDTDTAWTNLLPKIRTNQGLAVVILIVSIIGWAALSSLKKDPNYPIQ